MNIGVRSGKYVVAVSGGVDSMALLHALVQMADDQALALVVAHFEHGIRQDSMQDMEVVAAAAQQYGLPFIYKRGFLGPDASEAQAREARYAFLEQVRAEQGADAIMTAHHQDDVLETAVINMTRGTGSRGLTSLQSAGQVVRPLLAYPKEALVAYARQHNLAWRDDSTNQDERYLRNYIRRRVMPAITPDQRARLLDIIATTAALHAEIDTLLAPHITATQLDRRWFIGLPHAVAREVMAAWLRRHGAAFDRKTIERLVVFTKTAQPHKLADVDAGHRLHISKEYIVILLAL